MYFHSSKVIGQFIDSNKKIVLVSSEEIILPRIFLHYLLEIDTLRDPDHIYQFDIFERNLKGVKENEKMLTLLQFKKIYIL